jgi:hypothetical protein
MTSNPLLPAGTAASIFVMLVIMVSIMALVAMVLTMARKRSSSVVPVTVEADRNRRAGWYPDPIDASQLRWFDGNGWTSHQHRAG